MSAFELMEYPDVSSPREKQKRNRRQCERKRVSQPWNVGYRQVQRPQRNGGGSCLALNGDTLFKITYIYP